MVNLMKDKKMVNKKKKERNKYDQIFIYYSKILNLIDSLFNLFSNEFIF